MKKIKLKDKEYFESQRPLYTFISCEYSFANLAMWGTLYDVKYKDKNGTPIIYIGRDDAILFPQIPDITPKELVLLSEEITGSGGRGNISQVPEEYILEHPSIEEYFEITENDAFSDYIHSTERLALLQGKKLRKKRNLISQFIGSNPEYKEISINRNCIEECFNLATSFYESQSNSGENEEITALKNAFTMFDELSLAGRGIYVKKNLVAFSIFSKNIDGSFVVHFEKHDRAYKGAAQVINKKTAEYLSGKCEFINREQDLGIIGLKKAKRSYDPDTILINYELTPKS